MAARVTSADGTEIAFERAGDGPAVILVGGGLTDRSENAPLVPALAARFTVFNYDRRGRGASGDTLPYALAREIEDIDALIAEAGGSAHLYGVSSGGALTLEATAAGLAVDRAAVYEVPYVPQMAGFFGPGAKAIAAIVPDATRQTLKGQGHVADPTVVAAALARFFDR